MVSRTLLIILAGALAAGATSAAAIRKAPPTHRPATLSSSSSHRAATHTARARRPLFRPARSSAVEEARRLGTEVGQGCKGKADIARNDHEWVVLCSNGKTYVLESAAQHAGTPAAECSLAGIGPAPACFTE